MNEETCEASVEEQMQRLTEAAKKAGEELRKWLERIMPAVQELAKRVSEALAPVFSNKRVIHLANHSKKARVRKKNIHRISKSIRRGLKKNG